MISTTATTPNPLTSCCLTFGNDPPNGTAHEHAPAPLDVLDLRRVVPFLDVRAPPVRALAAGLDGLLVCAFARDTDVAGEEEVDDGRDLAREEEERGVCPARPSACASLERCAK